MGRPKITGFGHIDLTVTDLARSVQWWQDVMAFKAVRTARGSTYEVCSMTHPSGLGVSLMAHDSPASGRFDERAVGLDHLAFAVADRAELERWSEHLDSHGVAHEGIKDEIGGPLIAFRDPDNIQLEVHAYDPALLSAIGIEL
jgi:catechol 2,3-dioxygenase-like lactoylglutathione lyase family enzyme